jgi:hypothetical protein
VTHPQNLADAARRVAEYVRQRDITMSGGNVGDVITTIHADPETGPAHLDVNDLRALLAGVPGGGPETRLHEPDSCPTGPGCPTSHCATSTPLAGLPLPERLRRAVSRPGDRLPPAPLWGEGQPGYADEQESLWDWIVRAVWHLRQSERTT